MYTIPTFGKRNPIERKQMIPRRTWQDAETVDPFGIGNIMSWKRLEDSRRPIFLPLQQPFLALFPETSVSHAPHLFAFRRQMQIERVPAAVREGGRSRALARPHPFPESFHSGSQAALSFALCHASVSRHNVSAISLPNSPVIRYSHCRSLASRGIGHKAVEERCTVLPSSDFFLRVRWRNL